MILKLFAVGLIAVLLCIFLRRYHPEAATLTAIGAGLVILALSTGMLGTIVPAVQGMATRAGVPPGHLMLLLKVLGISYLGQFTASIARDGGETALAQKIEFGAKICIMALITPLFITLVQMITDLLP